MFSYKRHFKKYNGNMSGLNILNKTLGDNHTDICDLCGVIFFLSVIPIYTGVTMDNSSVYTQEEQDLLQITKDVRKRIIEDMMKSGTPGYTEVEVLNQVMSALDKSINDAATIRQKYRDTNTRAETLATVLETLKQITAMEVEAAKSNRVIETELDVTFIPDDIVPGEQDMEQKQFTLDEMMKEE